MKVRKKNGKLEDFNKNKIVKSCKKAGASAKIASDIANVVSNQIYDGVSTSEIRVIVLRELDRKDKKAATAFRGFKK